MKSPTKVLPRRLLLKVKSRQQLSTLNSSDHEIGLIKSKLFMWWVFLMYRERTLSGLLLLFYNNPGWAEFCDTRPQSVKCWFYFPIPISCICHIVWWYRAGRTKRFKVNNIGTRLSLTCRQWKGSQARLYHHPPRTTHKSFKLRNAIYATNSYIQGPST